MAYCLSLIFLLASTFFQQPAKMSANELPSEWIGDWVGTLMIPTAKTPQEVPME